MKKAYKSPDVTRIELDASTQMNLNCKVSAAGNAWPGQPGGGCNPAYQACYGPGS